MNEPAHQSYFSVKIPLKKAALGILLSILTISGTSGFALLYYRHVKDLKRLDHAYNIVSIIQTTHERTALKTGCLAELLGLSIDRPKNLYSFNSREAVQKLLACPVIKTAAISKVPPGIIYVDYTLREPVAFLGDYQNTAIDGGGVPFPFKPYFTPKKLPEIYLGIEQDGEAEDLFRWGAKLEGSKIELALGLLDLLNCYLDGQISLTRIDVSKAFALSYGQRQIVLIMEDRMETLVNEKPSLNILTRILRLNPDNYQEQFANFSYLRKLLRDWDRQELELQRSPKTAIIDLRLSELAFIEPVIAAFQ